MNATLYLILAAIVAIALIVINEWGYGGLAFVPLTLLTCWLMTKAFNLPPET